MYVKGLTLKGFKSFADPVTLELQPGVNVVVGPNGSGKSNVIDAVAWVLGAQGAKSLRGGKMDDVIFAGTGKRPALGRAEVSLTIDNSDNRIPVEFSEVTITRTLFRSGESDYAINGVSCRLLDIQELLSDSGVGRQQHVIVSQGNLAAILNARPEDRRMVIEEAAGVLKYRKRREKSQRRLESTEQNLERLQDLVREVRQQLRPLQKQAEAAMRHESVTTELRGIRLFVSGRDILQLRSREESATTEFEQLNDQTEGLRNSLEQSDISVAAAESEMAEFGSEDLGDQVERLERVLQKAKGMSALIAERGRGLERDLQAQVSKDVVASLEHDASNVRTELETVVGEQATLQEPSDQLAHAEGILATEWIAFEEEWGEGLPVTSTEAASIRGEAGALRKSIEALQQETARRGARLEQLRAQAQQFETDLSTGRSQHETFEQDQLTRQAAIEAAEQAKEQADAQFETAEAEFHEAQQALSVARARVEALTSALDASRARAGVERLAEIDGIAGTLAELVEVDDGYQAAFEAAAGEAMAAVVVESLSSARAALGKLRDGKIDGAVLVQGQPTEPPGGAPEGARGVESLRPHVKGTSKDVELLLDRVLCCCVVVDGSWQQAVDFALQYPDLVVVTKSGDRFSRNSWRIGTGGQGATMAAVNQAQAEVDAAETVFATKREVVDIARAARGEANQAEQQARRALQENERAIANAINVVERVESRQGSAQDEISSIETNIEGLAARMAEAQARVDELEARLPELEAAEASGEERARLWREARGVLEDRSTELRKQRNELEVRASALDERQGFLSRRLEALETRLEQHKIEVAEAAQRRSRIQYAIGVARRLQTVVDGRIVSIDEQLERVREVRNRERDRRRAVSDRLEEARKARSQIERELLAQTEKRQQLEVRQTEVRMRLETLLETLERELEVDADTAIAASETEPELPQGQTAKQRMAELERDIRQMGPVNPLALEEFQQVQERHEFLDKQLQDVQESRKELIRVIRAVDAEIVEVFKGAYADVARHFEDLIAMLFPGGSGNLRLTDPENPLETGVEIEAKPSGKNVRTLSLLSGGERSLVSMAFLFAVFRSRPSPFYLLDEVEAALDDINLSRFLKLIDEFRQEAQLVIVSHQKRTMEKADCLYGVSMQLGGSTKIVSERVNIDLTDKQSA